MIKDVILKLFLFNIIVCVQSLDCIYDFEDESQVWVNFENKCGKQEGWEIVDIDNSPNKPEYIGNKGMRSVTREPSCMQLRKEIPVGALLFVHITAYEYPESDNAHLELKISCTVKDEIVAFQSLVLSNAVYDEWDTRDLLIPLFAPTLCQLRISLESTVEFTFILDSITITTLLADDECYIVPTTTVLPSDLTTESTNTVSGSSDSSTEYQNTEASTAAESTTTESGSSSSDSSTESSQTGASTTSESPTADSGSSLSDSSTESPQTDASTTSESPTAESGSSLSDRSTESPHTKTSASTIVTTTTESLTTLTETTIESQTEQTNPTVITTSESENPYSTETTDSNSETSTEGNIYSSYSPILSFYVVIIVASTTSVVLVSFLLSWGILILCGKQTVHVSHTKTI